MPNSQRSIPADVFDLFPVLADMLRRRGGDLSGGQQQQLAIGRALVTRPKLLLMDEPATGLDVRSTASLVELVESEKQRGSIVIIVTHEAKFAELVADRVLFMDRGRIEEPST